NDIKAPDRKAESAEAMDGIDGNCNADTRSDEGVADQISLSVKRGHHRIADHPEISEQTDRQRKCHYTIPRQLGREILYFVRFLVFRTAAVYLSITFKTSKSQACICLPRA